METSDIDQAMEKNKYRMSGDHWILYERVLPNLELEDADVLVEELNRRLVHYRKVLSFKHDVRLAMIELNEKEKESD